MDAVTVAELAVEEDRLLAQVEHAQGHMEQKWEWLRARGVFAAYSKVHRAYVALIADTPEGTEALKRALFLQWIAAIEPTVFTGIAELRLDTQRAVAVDIERRLTHGQADYELMWMLRWYDSVLPWYFDDFADLPQLRQFLEDKYPDIRLARVFTEESLKDRGQMGAYWLEMLRGQEKQRQRP